MKVRTKTAVYGIAGFAVAGLMIFSGSMLGLLSLNSAGAVSIMLTDPPSVPAGVSAVYITYSDVGVHAVGLGESGWVSVPGQGTIDTLGLVNLSQTISTGTIPKLEYNLVAFNITDVEVTFNGKNYSATVDSGRLVVPIVGGLKVDATVPAAALVDITPTVINVGNQTSPSFAIATGARALQVPAGEYKTGSKVGDRASLEGRGWFQSFSANHSESLALSSLSLTTGGFSFSASNPGSDPLTLRMVVLAPAGPGSKPSFSLTSITDAFVFFVRPDGSLQAESGPPGQVMSLLGSSGFTLAGGASQKFTFSGTLATLLSNEGVSSGKAYYAFFFGSQAPVSTTIIAA